MIEDSKGVSRSSKTKKEGQWNDQKKKEQTMTLHNKIILLIYINNMYVTLDNVSSELTSTWAFSYILAIQINNEPTASNYK
jgi:hypothetical protein